MRPRVVNYSTTLPTTRPGWRRVLASTGSIVLHIVLITLILLRTRQQAAAAAREAAQPQQQIQPIQLTFAPPRPTPTPRAPAAPQAPAVPITEGPDRTPGTTAQVAPKPEENPNATPNTARSEATRPDPGLTEHPAEKSATTPPPSTAATANPTADAQPAKTLESEAQRIFGRPSAKLGPVAGTRDNRPWESPIDMNSRGCTVPEDSADSTLPKGMAMIAGRIFNERTGEPLGGARLQILGTPYGAFADASGYYKLYFDRTLVNRCRSQSVRVTAPGYQQRDVQLYIGVTPNGDVPLSRY